MFFCHVSLFGMFGHLWLFLAVCDHSLSFLAIFVSATQQLFPLCWRKMSCRLIIVFTQKAINMWHISQLRPLQCRQLGHSWLMSQMRLGQLDINLSLSPLANHLHVIASDGHHLIVCLTWPEKKHRHILIFYAEQDWPRPKALPDDTKARPHSSILTTTALNSVNSGLIRGSNVFVEIFGWRVCRQTVHKASFVSLFSSDILVNSIRPCKTSDTQHNG